MHDPDVILRVDSETDCLPLIPMIRQRLRKERIHFEARNFDHLASVLSRHVLKETLSDAQRDKQHDKHHPRHDITPSVHTSSSNSWLLFISVGPTLGSLRYIASVELLTPLGPPPRQRRVPPRLVQRSRRAHTTVDPLLDTFALTALAGVHVSL